MWRSLFQSKISESLIEEMANALVKGDRRTLSKAITLIESTLPQERRAADYLLDAACKKIGPRDTVRVGFSGPPGVGKSTFIEAVGKHIIKQGKKLAVLAVDPSSARTGGSILGDKTRMPVLSVQENVYVRPSPNCGTLGGVSRATAGTIELVEAAGYDTVFVETVGVGQSEIAVEDMVDCFVLLASPGGGDELQGVKRGIMESADLVVVTKADGDLEKAARRAATEINTALTLMPPKYPNIWLPEVITASSVTGKNVDHVWNTIVKFCDTLKSTPYFKERRGKQGISRMWEMINDDLLSHFRVRIPPKFLADIESKVKNHQLLPSQASSALLDNYIKQIKDTL